MPPQEDNTPNEPYAAPQPQQTDYDQPYQPAPPQLQPQFPPQPVQRDFQAFPQPQAAQPQFPPVNPAFGQPQERYAVGYPPAKKSNKKKMVLITALIIALLGAGAAAAYMMYFAPKSPDDIFQASLRDAFTTSNITQVTKMDGAEMSFTAAYDLKSVKDPRVNTDVSIASEGTEIKVKGYGSIHDSYVQIHEFKGGTMEFPASLKDKWIQVIKDDELAEGASTLDTFYDVYDPTYAALGHYIYGNFSDKDRTEILDYITKNRIYEYDSKTAQRETLDNREVYVYDVKMDKEKLAAYNKKVGAMMGMSEARIAEVADALETTEAKLYIDIKQPRLLKVEAKSGLAGGTTTIYSKWGQTTLPSEPTPDYQYKEFIDLVSKAATPAEAPQDIAKKAQDTERQTDILALQMQLEVYFADNVSYPTLSDLNDPAWRTENLKGINDDAFKDPKAADSQLANKPTIDRYSYEVGEGSALNACDNIGRRCGEFRLTAFLSDGSRFIKDSL